MRKKHSVIMKTFFVKPALVLLSALLISGSMPYVSYGAELNAAVEPKASSDLINLGGFAQRFLSKQPEEYMGITRDLQGFLHLSTAGSTVNGDPDISGLLRIKSLLDQKGIPALYVLTGDKNVEGYTTFSSKKTSMINRNMDYLSEKISQNGMTVLDLRQEYKKDGLDPSSLWYITDHHWRVETAFYAYGKVLAQLNQSFGVSFPTTPFLTDIRNYRQISYPQSYLGSWGKVTGKYFGGIDDFTLLLPNFPTSYFSLDYYRFFDSPTKSKFGTFEEVLIDQRPLAKDASLTANKFASYLSGDYPERTIVNYSGQGKYLVIQDSYGLPLSAFLSLSFYELTVIDLRHYTFNTLDNYLSQRSFDGVIFINQLPS